MAITSIIRQECKTCGKIAIETSRLKIGRTIIIKLACGHILHDKTLQSSDKEYDSLIFADNCKPRSYQIDAIKFAENSSVRCIIADEQGLGKTIESLCTLKLHQKELLPAVIVAPTTVKIQWLHEILRICGNGREFLTQVIQSGNELAMPGFQIYVVTYDILKKDNLFKLLPDGTIKTIIIDECQRIKNHLSDRAKAVQKLARTCPHVIAMSGTPIKNNAGEYFTVLNLVKPTLFPHYQKFIDNYCDAYSNGWSQKIGGLKNPERFHEDTKDIVIRRTKSEVLADLPKLDRKFFHIELDRKLNKAYSAALDELDEMLYADDVNEFERSTNMIAIMSKMRHITGIGKTDSCIDYVTEFLLSNDRKLVIFTHHNDVMDILENQLNQWLKTGDFDEVLKLHSGLDGTSRANLVEKFKTGSNRVLIASTLAAGEGLNLQFCSDAILLERQWNPANEEQVEARFHRFGQMNPVSVTYMIAIETIDEYFSELVEVKRSIVAAALDNKEIQWNQSSLLKELADILVAKGKKKWSL